MSTLTVVQARLGSQRLPGKVLADVGGKTVLERVIDRVRMTDADLGQVVVATTPRSIDNLIEVQCDLLGVDCYRSSEHNVLNRFYRAAEKYRLTYGDTIVRVTADCPLLCPELLAATVEKQRSSGADYVGVADCPNGLGQEAISYDALATAWDEVTMSEDDAEHREHVITYIEGNPGTFDVTYVDAPEALSARAHWRLTLDDKPDLRLLRRLFDASAGALFGMRSEEILGLVAADVEMRALAERRP